MAATVDSPFEKCTISANNSSCRIHRPLNFQCQQDYLASHSNQKPVQLLLKGLIQEFRIGLNNFINSLHLARKNLQGATLHSEVVDKYLKDQFALNRVNGPYSKSICSTKQISRFGIIPKSHVPNKWCLFIDLSHPQGHSVNDNIPKTLCSLFCIYTIGRFWNLAPYLNGKSKF